MLPHSPNATPRSRNAPALSRAGAASAPSTGCSTIGGAEKATLYAYRRNLRLAACDADDTRIDRVAWFSRGFYRILVRDGEVSVADLRMGLTPNYAFRFVVGRLDGGRLVPAPTRRMEGRGNIAADLDWLMANIRGVPATRLAEAAAKIEPARYAQVEPGTPPSRLC